MTEPTSSGSASDPTNAATNPTEPAPTPSRRWRLPRWRRLRQPRLKFTLLGLLVPGLLALLAYDSLNDYQTLHRTTDDAYDRALLGPALALSNSASVAPGGDVRLNVPQLAMAMLESAPGQRVYYRVAVVESLRDRRARQAGVVLPNMEDNEEGVIRVVAGMRDLTLPEHWPSGIEPVFYDAEYRQDPVRGVMLLRGLDRRDPQGRQLMIQVAESRSGRGVQQAAAWRNKLSRNLMIIGVIVVLVMLGVYWALRPVERLRAEVLGREADDLQELNATQVPQEIAPLVHAINRHVHRLRRVLEDQKQFLADTSHQLRTPLAIMRTQIEYALREADPQRSRDSLDGVLVQLDRAGRLTSQLLALAHARQHSQPSRQQRRVDVRRLVHDLVLQHLPLASARRQDFGWDDEAGAAPLYVMASESALNEALSNLVHNAIHYSPVGGRVTVATRLEGDTVIIRVSDDGPGVPPVLRQQVFERFQRGIGQADGGAGLGLAIAREFILASDGSIELVDGEPNQAGGVGLCAVVRLPLID